MSQLFFTHITCNDRLVFGLKRQAVSLAQINNMFQAIKAAADIDVFPTTPYADGSLNTDHKAGAAELITLMVTWMEEYPEWTVMELFREKCIAHVDEFGAYALSTISEDHSELLAFRTLTNLN